MTILDQLGIGERALLADVTAIREQQERDRLASWQIALQADLPVPPELPARQLHAPSRIGEE